jgi:hypothetical protein
MQPNVSFGRYTDKMTAANAQALTEALRTLIQGFNTKVQTTAGLPSNHQQLTRLLSKTIETANRDPGSHLRRAAEDAAKHVVALDRALEEELARSIEFPGRQRTERAD